jgi:hypothetical protein
MDINKIIIIVVVVVVSFSLSLSCTRKETWSVCLHKSVINSTNKTLYYEVKTDEGSKKEFISAFDSINLTFYREHEAETFLLASTVRQNRIQIEQEMIFNLTDTCKYEYGLKYEKTPQQGNTEAEKTFARHLAVELGEHSTDKNSVIIIKLNVMDSILQIMQKDYTMLDKFSEYYEQK